MGEPKDWGWKVDPTVRGKYKCAQAPEGHPRRCQGRKRGSQPPVQCQSYALAGRRYCKWHGGMSHASGYNRRPFLRFYSKHAGPVLAEKLAQLREAGPDERHSLAEEIDLARVVACRYVQIYERAVLDPTSDASPDARAAATAGLRESLSHVSQVVSAAAKVQAVHESTIDVERLDFIVQQVVKAVEEVVAEERPDLAARLTDRLKEIRMPERKGARGGEESAALIREAVREAELSVPAGEGEAA